MKVQNKRFLLTFLTLFFLLLTHADDKFTAADIFTNHMVLQRNEKVKIWGNAPSDNEVRVEINGRKKTIKAKEGKWIVTLSPMKSGGPYEMKITCEKTIIILSDILIGDVWLAGGQSNMEFPLRRIQNAQEEMKSANYPGIRYYKAPRKIYANQEIGKQKWTICSPETVSEISAIAYYFATGIQREQNVPIGIIQCPFGGTTAEAWMSKELLLTNKDFIPIIQRYDNIISSYKPNEYESLWGIFKIKTDIYNDSIHKGFPKAVKPVEPIGEKNFRRPYTLFENMLKPLMPYTLKGFLFYQGESNTARGYQYRKLFPAMIKEWRRGWEQGDIPFLFIQLPKFETKTHEWAELREAQLLTSKKIKNTGMVVAYDQGNPNDIHPTVKRVVGFRLTQLALNKVYGHNIICSGPTFQSMKIKPQTIEIYFSNIGNGLVASDSSDKIFGFTVAGTDHVFHSVEAQIVKNVLIINTIGIEKPNAVRYAWANSMDINLFNKEGFPASPFRTDSYKLTTFNNN